MMDRVLISLIPILLFSVFLFGLRVLVLLSIVCIVGFLTEYAAARLISGSKAKVSEAAIVSCVLFTLTLPPSTPFWVAAVGIAFGLFFGKGVFGGFGRNIFNPALVGRCFVYISFPAYLTVQWAEPFLRFPGGLIRFSQPAELISRATPLFLAETQKLPVGYLDLFFGFRAGSLGEVSAVLIVVAAIYLLVTKTASGKIMLATVAGFLFLNTILYLTGVITSDPLFSLLSGGILFASVFMATDPVSAPRQEHAKLLYGLLVGILASAIRNFSIFVEGAMFAILIANIFVPLIDRQIGQLVARKKVRT